MVFNILSSHLGFCLQNILNSAITMYTMRKPLLDDERLCENVILRSVPAKLFRILCRDYNSWPVRTRLIAWEMPNSCDIHINPHIYSSSKRWIPGEIFVVAVLPSIVVVIVVNGPYLYPGIQLPLCGMPIVTELSRLCCYYYYMSTQIGALRLMVCLCQCQCCPCNRWSAMWIGSGLPFRTMLLLYCASYIFQACFVGCLVQPYEVMIPVW